MGGQSYFGLEGFALEMNGFGAETTTDDEVGELVDAVTSRFSRIPGQCSITIRIDLYCSVFR